LDAGTVSATLWPVQGKKQKKLKRDDQFSSWFMMSHWPTSTTINDNDGWQMHSSRMPCSWWFHYSLSSGLNRRRVQEEWISRNFAHTLHAPDTHSTIQWLSIDAFWHPSLLYFHQPSTSPFILIIITIHQLFNMQYVFCT
jgi:hypothetical protein